MSKEVFTRIVTKYLNNNIFKLDELLEAEKLTLGEYMIISLLLKNLSELETLTLMFTQEVEKVK